MSTSTSVYERPACRVIALHPEALLLTRSGVGTPSPNLYDETKDADAAQYSHGRGWTSADIWGEDAAL